MIDNNETPTTMNKTQIDRKKMILNLLPSKERYVYMFMKGMTPREIEVVMKRAGIEYSEVPMTYPQLSNEYGLSKTRIQSIYKRGLKKLK